MAFNAEFTAEMEKAFAKKVQEVEQEIGALEKVKADKCAEAVECLLEQRILEYTPIGINTPSRDKRIEEVKAKREKALHEHATAYNDLTGC